jgi:hypothetical protein
MIAVLLLGGHATRAPAVSPPPAQPTMLPCVTENMQKETERKGEEPLCQNSRVAQSTEVDEEVPWCHCLSRGLGVCAPGRTADLRSPHQDRVSTTWF